jgi:hypothetical protein
VRLPSELRWLAGEKVLAAARTDRGWLAGTRSALVWPDGPDVVLPWEQVDAADWDADTSRLQVTGVGEYGAERPSYLFTVEEPGRLLELVRERVTASLVLQRRVSLGGGRGLTVIARRSPAGGALRWMHEYDAGVDPADPEVARLAASALAAARAEVGEPI